MRRLFLAGSLLAVSFAAPAQAADAGVTNALSMHLTTKQAFAEAAACHNGSVLVGKVAAARIRGDSRAKIEGALPPNMPPVVMDVVNIAFSYPSPSPQNAEDYYGSCTATAIKKMNVSIENRLGAEAER